MKLVLDTNVLIAAFISEGVCHELLEQCFIRHQVVLSDVILREVEEVLRKRFRYADVEAHSVERILKRRAQLVDPSPLMEAACRDPDDDWILATALAGGCSMIVTGDKDLLELSEFKGVRIVSPSSFLETGEDPD